MSEPTRVADVIALCRIVARCRSCYKIVLEGKLATPGESYHIVFSGFDPCRHCGALGIVGEISLEARGPSFVVTPAGRAALAEPPALDSFIYDEAPE